MSEESSKRQSRITINDNLLLDNMHIRLCALETKMDKIGEQLSKALKSRWISLAETVILAIALIITAVLTL